MAILRDPKTGKFLKGTQPPAMYREGEGRAKENGKKGAEVFAENCKRRRSYREVFNDLRDLPIVTDMPDGDKASKPLDEAEMIALHIAAAKGDVRALKLVLDMTGEIEKNIKVHSTGDPAVNRLEVVVMPEEDDE